MREAPSISQRVNYFNLDRWNGKDKILSTSHLTLITLAKMFKIFDFPEENLKQSLNDKVGNFKMLLNLDFISQ